MKREMNIMEKVGFCLISEPSFNESDPQLPNWIGWAWVGLMFFSVFLIIVGNMVGKYNK
jgi:hypothetical protein